MKTKGYGSIVAFPLSRTDMTSDVEFAMVEPAFEAEDEKDQDWCRLSLDLASRMWLVRTPDGRRLVVPADQAIVTWKEKPGARQVIERQLNPELQPPPMDERPVAACAFCAQTYRSPIDAEVCYRKDIAQKENPFPAGDCRKCGYPIDLHAKAGEVVLEGDPISEALLKTNTALGLCTFVIDGKIETAKADVRAKAMEIKKSATPG